jgi:NitT/TauT family transport system ATP-binding protein
VVEEPTEISDARIVLTNREVTSMPVDQRPPKLRLADISHAYEGTEGEPLEALRNISLAVSAGEFVAIVGGSGSGKTTLLRIIDRLVMPSSGAIFVDGERVERPGGRISFVFQQDCLLPWRTVLANARYGLDLRGVPREEAQERARHYLDLVGLKRFESYFPHQLSGGMRQRVNLARALALEPDVLLMDEPFAALDAQTREMMQLELLRIWQSTKKTILFVTHQLDEAVFLADRVVALSARPGTIRDIVPIDLPQPRHIDMKRTEAFQAYVGQLWSLIEGDVRRGFQEDAVVVQ